MTASTSEAYSFLLTLLCDPGDSILVPTPSYPLLSFLADIAQVKLIPYPLVREDQWHPDWSVVNECTHAKAVVIVSPNNPTGSYLDEQGIADLGLIAAKHNMAIISDEVFSLYTHNRNSPSPSVLQQSDALCFALNGLSKSALLPHYKLGWMVTHGPAEKKQEAQNRLSLIADTFLSINTPVQHMLPSLLSLTAPVVQSLQHRLQTNINTTKQALMALPIVRMLSMQAGWYVTLQTLRANID